MGVKNVEHHLVIAAYGCDECEQDLFIEQQSKYGVTINFKEEEPTPLNVRASDSFCISISHKVKLTQEVLQALHRSGIRYISTRSIGCNHIDLQAAKKLGMTVEPVAYSPQSVAEYAVLFILMMIRRVKPVMERGENYDFRPEQIRGRELRDMTVGVIGTGRIGRTVIKQLQAFGCRILAYDEHESCDAEYVSLDTLLRESDVVTVHMPLLQDTYHFLDEHRLRQMKKGACIINTGRGGLIDTKALVEALQDNQLAGAALDVIEGEENIFYRDCRTKELNHQLLKQLLTMPNVVITPHIAYYTDHAVSDMVTQSIENCIKYAQQFTQKKREELR